jgi:magnesium-transporting ATPase (P-type)
MSDLLSLISRLEAAKEVSRELDAEIEISRRRFLFGAAAVAGMSIQPGGWIVGGDSPNPIKAPAYTSSVDAALSLVPEGLMVSMTIGSGQAVANVKTGSILNPKTREWSGYAATPALALCIASLRARATT